MNIPFVICNCFTFVLTFSLINLILVNCEVSVKKSNSFVQDVLFVKQLFLEDIDGLVYNNNDDSLYVRNDSFRNDRLYLGGSYHKIGTIDQDFFQFYFSKHMGNSVSSRNLNMIIEPEDKQQFNRIIFQVQFMLRNQTNRNYGFIKVFIKFPYLVPLNENISSLLSNYAGYFEITNQIYILIYYENNTNFSLWEIYTVKDIKVIQRLFFSNASTKELIPGLLQRRSNLQKAVVRGISPIDKDEERLVKIRFQGDKLRFVDGFVVNVLRDLADSLNFNVQAVEASNYIIAGPNDTLLGMGKQLIDGEADLAVSLAFFVPYRARYLTYLHPISNVKVMAFFRKPDSGSSINNFMKPFKSYLWVAIIITCCFIIISLCCHKLVIVLALDSRSSAEYKDYWFYDETFIWTFGILCQQGWHASPSTMSIQIIFYFGFILGVVLFSAYCASIVSALTNPLNLVTSIQDLINLEHFLLVDSNTKIEAFLETPTNKWKLEKLLKPNYNSSEGITLTLKGNHAILLTSDSFYTKATEEVGKYIREEHVEKYLCETIESVPLTNVVMKSGMVVPKGSPLKDLFNYKILMIMERGLNSKYMNKLIEETNPTCSSTDNSAASFKKELGVNDLNSAFLILIFGSLFAFIAILIEFIWFRWLRVIFKNLYAKKSNDFEMYFMF